MGSPPQPEPSGSPPQPQPSERFEKLFRSHHAAVVAYVRRRARPDFVDDVVGETFLVAWRRQEAVPENALPWLLAVARNVLATQRRAARRRDALAARISGAASSGAGSSGAGVELSPAETADEFDGRLAAGLARLAPKDREALTLIAWDGLSPQQAALVLGEAPGTFRVRLYRARRRLVRLLQGSPDASAPTSDRRTRVVQETAHE